MHNAWKCCSRVDRCVDDEELENTEDSMASLLSLFSHSLPMHRLLAFKTRITTQMQEEAVSRVQAMNQKQIQSPREELFVMMYDVLQSMPAELIRLVCAYHSMELQGV